jgi:hypothetical protein
MDKVFSLEIGQRVELVESGEQGKIVGRAEFAEDAETYYVQYKAADGRLTRSWWPASALKVVDA